MDRFASGTTDWLVLVAETISCAVLVSSSVTLKTTTGLSGSPMTCERGGSALRIGAMLFSVPGVNRVPIGKLVLKLPESNINVPPSEPAKSPQNHATDDRGVSLLGKRMAASGVNVD